MNEVHSLEEAMNWFLRNSSGKVLCINGNDKKLCNVYSKHWTSMQNETL